MFRSPVIRLIAAGVAGAASALALLALITLLNADDGFAHTTATTGLGWTVPLIAGVLTGAMAWALLVSRRDAAQPDPPSAERCACTSCGGIVLGDWRLCPHCGERLAEVGVTRTTC